MKESETAGQRRTDRCRDSLTGKEKDRQRLSLKKKKRVPSSIPSASAYQWVSINHSQSSVCLRESAQHQYGLTTTMHAAGIQNTKRQQDRGDMHTHGRAQESEANPSPAPRSGIPLIPSARC